MPRKKASKSAKNAHKEVSSYTHEGEKRKNNPPVGLVSSATDQMNGRTKYEHDPHIDPYLSWAGKKEGTSFDVQNVSLHVHERIDPERIVHQFTKKQEEKGAQMSLFEQPDNELPINQAIDFYSHEQDWSNRLIAGDSLLVMNSLLQKEGMAGKVQMIYIDPPYGIKYNSNFQPFTSKRDVKDRDEDIPAEPEMLQAFRDTWELGIHSYLTYLRDRILLSKELLKETGSCFVQISDENVHHVRELMDEIFGKENFVSQIKFFRAGAQTTKFLADSGDYIVWYAKDKSKAKFNHLYTADGGWVERAPQKFYEFPDGEIISANKIGDRDTSNARIFATNKLESASYSESSRFPVEFEGRTFEPKRGWSTTPEGFENLRKKNRLVATGNTLRWKVYTDDFPYSIINNNWTDTSTGFGAEEKFYVVQTTSKVVQRCLLMVTDPGDIVFDPTCGSGTSAFVAEQWGRRWITCDTSRVAVALAKQRLMTAKFDYYQLAIPEEGVSSGFNYKKAHRINLRSLANDEQPKEEILYDQPEIDKDKVRATGPFTVEAVPSLRVRSIDGNLPKVESKGEDVARSGETASQALWRDELKTTGIRTTGGKKIEFARVEPMSGTTWLHAEGEILEKDGNLKKAFISFGPDFGALEQRQVEQAIQEARQFEEKPDFVIFAAFHFDPEAAKDVDQIEWKGVQILKAQMSVDLLTQDLRKKKRENQSYWLIGQPDIEVKKSKDGTYQVEVKGFDYYNPVSGEVDSGGANKIAMWMLDTDYDEQSLLPEQVFFPMKDSKRDWTRLAKSLNSLVDEDKLDAFSGNESLPFKPGEHKKIAVKIVDDRGIESLVVRQL